MTVITVVQSPRAQVAAKDRRTEEEGVDALLQRQHAHQLARAAAHAHELPAHKAGGEVVV